MDKKFILILIACMMVLPSTTFAKSKSASFSVTLRFAPKPITVLDTTNMQEEYVSRSGELVLVKTFVGK